MAGEYDFTLDQGATFEMSMVYKVNDVAVDLTGATARMQVRKGKDDTNFVLELTTENGGISITALSGQIDLIATDTATAAIEQGDYYYDLELIFADTKVKRLLKGIVTVDREVTR